MTLRVVPIEQEADRFFLQREYAFGYLALSQCSDEERIIGDTLLQVSRLRGRPAEAIMDIGCGDGRITRRFSRSARRITLFEPNPVLFSLAVSRLSRGRPVLDAYHSVFPTKATVPTRSHDFIIASNMLYHVDRKKWMKFFRAIAGCLEEGGICAVALWNEDSDAMHLSSALVPSRWLFSAQDLLVEAAKFERIGLTKVKQIDLDLYIKAHTREMARFVTAFLVGNSWNSGERRNEIETTIEEKVCARGLRNSQSVLVFQKQSDVE